MGRGSSKEGIIVGLQWPGDDRRAKQMAGRGVPSLRNPVVMSEARESSRRVVWIRYLVETLRLTLALAIPVGMVIGLARAWPYLKHGFLGAVLGFVSESLNLTVVVVLALLLAAGAFHAAFHRLTGRPRWSSLIAVGLCCAPFFALWGYRFNSLFVRDLITLRSALWNCVILMPMVAVWLLLSVGYDRWVRSRSRMGAHRRWSAIVILATVVLAVNAATVLAAGLLPPARPNVIVLLVDALRPDHLGCYGYSRDTSPNIDALGSDSVVFTQAVSHSTFTKVSVASIFTSLYPYQHGVYWGQKMGAQEARVAHVLSDDNVTLAEAMLDAGYLTMGIAKNRHIHRRYGFGQGFVEYNDRVGLFEQVFAAPTSLKGRWWYIDAINAYVLKWLSRVGRHHSFFLYVHYMDLHDPYRPKSPYREMYGTYSDVYSGVDFGEWGAHLKAIREGRVTLTQDDVLQLEAYYDGQLHWIDSQIGVVLDELKRSGMYDDSLIVLTSDHGDGFMEHGFISHSTTPYDELVRVPLMVKFPNSDPRATVTAQVQHVDLMGTILAYLGLTMPAAAQGIDLMANLESEESGVDRFSYAEISQGDEAYPAIAIRTERYKYIHFQHEPDELYDLTTDPGERSNVIADHQDQASAFRLVVLDIVGQRRERGLDTIELSEDAIEELKALGYVE